MKYKKVIIELNEYEVKVLRDALFSMPYYIRDMKRREHEEIQAIADNKSIFKKFEMYSTIVKDYYQDGYDDLDNEMVVEMLNALQELYSEVVGGSFLTAFDQV